MDNFTREQFERYLDRQAELNDVPYNVVHGGKAFTIAPSIQQKLETAQQESSAFLSQINIAPVTEMEGEKLGLNISGPIASRTDTSGAGRRTPRDPTAMNQRGYKVAKTNSDTLVKYNKLDLWAKFPDFQTRMSNLIIERQKLDRICVGWNGTSVAATTDLVANPLLQDVNKGWLQYLRENAPAHVLSEGATDGEIRIGAAAGRDYYNIDALVMDAIHNLLPAWAQKDPNLVVFLGSDLLHDKYFPMVDNNQDPTEKLASDIIMSKKQIAGRPAAAVPYFPGDAIMVGRFTDLSLYFQEGKRRRTIVDNAAADQIETYESSNDGYVYEDTDFGLLLENITLEWA